MLNNSLWMMVLLLEVEWTLGTMRKESFLQKKLSIYKRRALLESILPESPFGASKIHYIEKQRENWLRKKTFPKRTYNCYKSRDNKEILKILRILNTVSVGMLNNTKLLTMTELCL